jgi:hypothetical protein
MPKRFVSSSALAGGLPRARHVLDLYALSAARV